MYINKKYRNFLITVNIIFIIFSVFNLIICVPYIVSEFVYYKDDINTALQAKSMASSIKFTIISIILLIIVYKIKNRIYYANFYSSYFENSLDGIINFETLAKVTVKNLKTIKRQITILRIMLMRNFKITKIKNKTVIELNSKKCLCICKSCDAQIEAKEYFTGICPYCNSSDLNAKVISGNRFYSISNDFKNGINNSNHYTCKNIGLKKGIFIFLFSINLFIIIILFMFSISNLAHYFDKSYQTKILLSPDNHLYSYKLIKADILDSFIYSTLVSSILTPFVIFRLLKIKNINIATLCSNYFAKSKTPLININDIPNYNKNYVKKINLAIKRHYLKNCTLEMHNDKLLVALSKKIVKDKCPNCGASIIGAVNIDYTCRYCNSKIMNVVIKK